MRWVEHAACMESRNTYRTLVAKPGGKRPLVRPKQRWDDLLKCILKQIGLV
jgi:hypothetical protein